MGVPCITTPLAFRALHAPENLILVAESAETFADAIELLLSQDLTEKSAASKQFVLENFDWKVINERLGLIFEI
jgi:glycosyltransferase involved in cell wall biosynthesis